MSSAFDLLLIPSWLVIGYVTRRLLHWDELFLKARRLVTDVTFSEDYVSGKVSRGFPLGVLGAGWALTVLIRSENLWIWPMRCFRPTFIGTVLGLEKNVPVQNVRVLSVADALLQRKAVRLFLGEFPERGSVITLYLRHAEGFLEALAASRHETSGKTRAD